MGPKDGLFKTCGIKGYRLAAGVLCGALILLVGCNGKPTFDTVKVRRGTIRDTFTEPARTRLEQEWPITVPVEGRIRRINLEPGDKVTSGQVLVVYDETPFRIAVAQADAAVREMGAQLQVNRYNALERTALLETKALISATSDTLRAADAQIVAEQARTERAAREASRIEELAKTKVIAPNEVDDARLQAETTRIELRRQEFFRSALGMMAVISHLGPEYIDKWLGRKVLEGEVMQHQAAQAMARLERARHDLELSRIVSPVSGVVLERYEHGESTYPTGHKLLLVGDPGKMEVVCDVLTQDALRLSVGGMVELRPGAGSESPLVQGQVKRIDPKGFTKLSSLGVEQQRVNVIISFTGQTGAIGVGYRLDATFETGRKDNAVVVPRFSILQGADGTSYAFPVRSGRPSRQPVKVGLRSDTEVEILEGLAETDEIVLAPDAALLSKENGR